MNYLSKVKYLPCLNKLGCHDVLGYMYLYSTRTAVCTAPVISKSMDTMYVHVQRCYWGVGGYSDLHTITIKSWQAGRLAGSVATVIPAKPQKTYAVVYTICNTYLRTYHNKALWPLNILLFGQVPSLLGLMASLDQRNTMQAASASPTMRIL